MLVVAAVFAFPVYQFLVLSFNGWPAPSKDVRLGPILLLPADRESLFVRPADSTAWPVADIVRLVATHSRHIRDRAPRVRVVGHVPFLDGPTLNYQSLLDQHQSLTYSGLEDRSLHRSWWDFIVVVQGPIRLESEYREPVLERVLDDQRLPFGVIGRVALPEGREAVVYQARDGEAPQRTVGENYVTATNRHGADLFSIDRVQWELPSGRSDIVTTRGDKPIEFQYVYCPIQCDRYGGTSSRTHRLPVLVRSTPSKSSTSIPVVVQRECSPRSSAFRRISHSRSRAST